MLLYSESDYFKEVPMDRKYQCVVECAIEYQNKLLIIRRPLGKHAGGLFAFPGGKVDEEDHQGDGDILCRAVKREVEEEVGLRLLDPLRYVTSNFFMLTDGTLVIDSIFHCYIKETSPKVIPSEREVLEYFWMSKDDIDQAEDAPIWLKKYVRALTIYDQQKVI